jgi:hypothetical protein
MFVGQICTEPASYVGKGNECQSRPIGKKTRNEKGNQRNIGRDLKKEEDF